MKKNIGLLLVCIVIFFNFNVLFASSETIRVMSSIDVLKDIIKGDKGKAPKYLLAHAKGLIIIPGIKKVGFIAGVKYGKGLIIVKKGGKWLPPSFITLSGGSFGFQIGAKVMDVLIILMTDEAVNKFTGNKIKLGVDIGVTAGPVGKEVGISQDDIYKIEAFSYEREKGIFAGLMIAGSVITHDNKANRNFYKEPITFVDIVAGKKPKIVPEEANKLMSILKNIKNTIVAFINGRVYR